ncbi:hypothetical protein JCM1840_006892 [Sporobolomyces johnsonii]
MSAPRFASPPAPCGFLMSSVAPPPCTPSSVSPNRRRLGLHPVLERKARPANPAQRKPVVGSWMMLPGASLARMIAAAGYDFLLVDCEHGNIADAEMHAIVHAVAAAGSSPLVRIAAPENYLVKRALDTGAHGILCPMMSSAEEARRLVSFAKFPVSRSALAADPSLVAGGVRGAGSPFAPAVFGQSLAEYTATANENTFVGVQIETREGLDACEEIARVEGIDMLFVGPNDLALSLGYPPTSHPDVPQVQAAIARVLAACRAAGKYAGMFCTSAEQVQERFAQGFDVMNLGADIVAISAWNASELGKLEGIL